MSARDTLNLTVPGALLLQNAEPYTAGSSDYVLGLKGGTDLMIAIPFDEVGGGGATDGEIELRVINGPTLPNEAGNDFRIEMPEVTEALAGNETTYIRILAADNEYDPGEAGEGATVGGSVEINGGDSIHGAGGNILFSAGDSKEYGGATFTVYGAGFGTSEPLSDGADIDAIAGNGYSLGGYINLTAGDANTDPDVGFGGEINLTAGRGNERGGALSLIAGAGQNDKEAGSIFLKAGQLEASNIDASTITIHGATAASNEGDIEISAGGAGSAISGASVFITGGKAVANDQNGGSITITGGANDDGDNAGAEIIVGGAESSDKGRITLNSPVGEITLVGINAANGTTACVFTAAQGPAAAQTSIQGWLAFNIGGTTRYVPFW